MQSAASRLSTSAALLAMAGSCLVLLGWAFDIAALKSPYGPITMKTNAAIAIGLTGSAVWAHNAGWSRLGTAAAALAMTIAVATLAQHLFGLDFGIDQLLFTEPAGALATARPNRMGPNGAVNLALANAALLCLFRGSTTTVKIGQGLVVTSLALTLLAFAGYLYGAEELYAVARYTGIAFHTVVAILALDVGILAARPDIGVAAVFTEDGPAGTLVRRLALPVVAMPLVIGMFVNRARNAGILDRGLGFAFFAVAVILTIGVIVWHTASSIAAADTERRLAERDRDRLLERERQARSEAEQANRVKDQFLATLSHELRTPLNVVLGWSQILETPHSPEQLARAAGVVARNGRLLARLVEDLLDISRITAGQMEVTRDRVSINDVVQAAVDALGPAAAQNGVRVNLALDPDLETIEADATRLQQVASNLVANALKFTPHGGQVDVRTAQDDGAVVLSVQDTGVGFDATFTPELFEPFRQADASYRREYGGLGLGLAIARHIVELHGGSISGTSPGPGRGATFTVRLPHHGTRVDAAKRVRHATS